MKDKIVNRSGFCGTELVILFGFVWLIIQFGSWWRVRKFGIASFSSNLFETRKNQLFGKTFNKNICTRSKFSQKNVNMSIHNCDLKKKKVRTQKPKSSPFIFFNQVKKPIVWFIFVPHAGIFVPVLIASSPADSLRTLKKKKTSKYSSNKDEQPSLQRTIKQFKRTSYAKNRKRKWIEREFRWR